MRSKQAVWNHPRALSSEFKENHRIYITQADRLNGLHIPKSILIRAHHFQHDTDSLNQLRKHVAHQYMLAGAPRSLSIYGPLRRSPVGKLVWVIGRANEVHQHSTTFPQRF